MSSFGIDRFTGAAITGWASVLQSVDVIFETEIGEEIMLEHFGGGLRRLLGRRLTPGILALASSIFALAISIWEPRLRVVRVRVAPSVEEFRAGVVTFVMEVVYRPKGHLGDLTEEPTLRLIGVAANDNGTLRFEDFNEAAA